MLTSTPTPMTPTPIVPSTTQTTSSNLPLTKSESTDDETSTPSPHLPHSPEPKSIEYVYDDIASIYNRQSMSFNLFNGETYEEPEPGKRYSGPIAHIALFSILCIILGFIAFLTVSTRLNMSDSDETPSHSLDGLHTHCHYDDMYFPVDKVCGIQVCQQQDIEQLLTLKLGWSDSLVQQRKYNADRLLDDVYTNYGILPDELMLNTISDGETFMKYENISIALSHIQMDLMYFCCYDIEEYQHIKRLFTEFYWSEFDVTFGNYTCLNMTHQDNTDYIMLLDEESQRKIRRWVDNFEDYLNYHKVEVKVNRIDGQLYGSTFARFDGYDEWMETVSLDEVRGLNGKYKGDWSDIKVTVSKHNLLMT